MVATGRSSTWWLRNHALPRTQAFFALVMWLFSTVNSMSSQTQPQKVQVALLTTFSSLADMQDLFRGSMCLFRGEGRRCCQDARPCRRPVGVEERQQYLPPILEGGDDPV